MIVVESGGKHAAFESFYAAEWKKAERLAFLLLGRRELAEEVAQEAFTAASLQWDTIENPAGFVHTVVVRRSRTAIRRLITERREFARLAPDSGGSSEAREMFDLLGRLPSAQRTAIVLRFYLSMECDDIATLMACKPSTVRSLQHRAMRTMRKELEP
jgi:RNA polymerase sigma factor (sigma-70 family)